MNERLREILEDAEVIFDNPDAHVPLALVSMEDFKLIAELIVKECADKAHEFIIEDGDEFPKTSVAYRIKQHFGVEE